MENTPTAPRFSAWRFLHAVFIEGGRFWERGRLFYNGAQFVLTAIMTLSDWRVGRFFFSNLGSYVIFALYANAFYTAA